jgi:hypothetical protein
MSNQVLKETIADYGFEETLKAMIKLIREGYILEFYSIHQSDLLKLQLEAILANWSLDSKRPEITFEIKEANILEQRELCPNFLK